MAVTMWWHGEHWPVFRIKSVIKANSPCPYIDCITPDGRREFGISLSRFIDELLAGNIYPLSSPQQIEVPNGSSQDSPVAVGVPKP